MWVVSPSTCIYVPTARARRGRETFPYWATRQELGHYANFRLKTGTKKENSNGLWPDVQILFVVVAGRGGVVIERDSGDDQCFASRDGVVAVRVARKAAEEIGHGLAGRRGVGVKGGRIYVEATIELGNTIVQAAVPLHSVQSGVEADETLDSVPGRAGSCRCARACPLRLDCPKRRQTDAGDQGDHAAVDRSLFQRQGLDP